MKTSPSRSTRRLNFLSAAPGHWRGILLAPVLLLGAAGPAGAELLTREALTITARPGAADERFGQAVALDGNMLVVGAPDANGSRGKVQVFYRNDEGADQWGLVATLFPTGGSSSDAFGHAVAIDNNTIVVGATGDDEGISNSGAVYVFEQNEGGADAWGLVAKLKAADNHAGKEFGWSVAVHDVMLVAGAMGDYEKASLAGAAYVFHRLHTIEWTQAAKLTAADGASGDRFGQAVALWGNTVAIGAYRDDDIGADSGSVYIFDRHQGGTDQWAQVRKRQGNAAGDEFGYALALEEGLLAVGSPKALLPGALVGRVTLLERHLGGIDQWGELKQLWAATEAGDDFGSKLAFEDDTLLIGVPGDDDAGADAGAAYLFRRDAGGNHAWGQLQKLTMTGGKAGDRFGTAVALRGNDLMIGADQDDPAGPDSGSVRWFERMGSRWVLDQKLEITKGENNSTWSGYDGGSLALGPDTLVAGAFEWSSAHGRVFLFHRNRQGKLRQWSHYKTLEGSRQDDRWFTGDQFGYSVALSGDSLLVGSPDDVSDEITASGVSGSWGIAYFFERNRGGKDNWAEVERTQGDNWSELGRFVALSPHVAVVAPGHSGLDWAEDPTAVDVEIYERTGDAHPWSSLNDARGIADLNLSFPVALDGDTLFTGHPKENKAYVSRRHVGTEINIWTQQLKPNQWGNIWFNQPRPSLDGVDGTKYGGSVATDGNTLVIGARLEDANGLDESGAVYVYERNQNGADGWGLVAKLTASDASAGSHFGRPVAISGNRIAVGAPGRENAEGAVYLFERNAGGPNHWGEVAKLVSPEDIAKAGFGQSIVLRGNTLVVAAPKIDDDYVYYDEMSWSDLHRWVYLYHFDNNQAPILNGAGNYTVETWEDASLGGTQVVTVSLLLSEGGYATDGDGDTCGIAVTALNTSQGRWYYAVSAGAAWQDFGMVFNGQARLLGPNSRLCFIPNPNFHGTIDNAIHFRIWDQTTGSSGGVGDCDYNGGGTPFSVGTGQMPVVIAPRNDNPVLDTSTAIYLPGIESDVPAAGNPGARVTNLIQGLWSDVDGDICGLAVTSVNNTHGDWQFSLDDGANWLSFYQAASSAARLLGPADRVRFVPAPGYSGSVINGVYFRAWDQTVGTRGGTADATGASGFSPLAEQLHIVVSEPVNHSPLLDNSGTPAFTPITRNATINPGDAVYRLISGIWTDSDGDTCGVAIIGRNTSFGSWQYRLSRYDPWTALPAVSSASALLLRHTASLRFAPNYNYVGTLGQGLTIRAWDQTAGTHGGFANASSGGGGGAFSSATEYLAITVTATDNHAPVLDNSGTVFLTSPRANALVYNTGDYVGDLIAGIVTDADGNPCGIVATYQYTYYGSWQYSLDDGVHWYNMGTAISMSNARLLGPGAMVRFVPNAGYSGTITQGLGFRAWDQTEGDSGELVNVTAIGGDLPYSALAEYLSVITLPENHAPVLNNSTPLSITPIDEDDRNNPGDRVGDLIAGRVTDADGNAVGIAVGVAHPYYGSWQYSLDGGSTWQDFGTIDGSRSRLLGPNNRVRFLPLLDYFGTYNHGLTFRAWDQTYGVIGGTANALTSGGGTAFSTATQELGIVVIQENHPPTGLGLAPAAVAENSPAGTVVGQFTTTDPNTGDSHSYSLVAGAGATDNAAFNIAGAQLRTGAMFDRETKDSYSVRVRSSDGRGGSYEQAFEISVGDVSDLPPTEVWLSPPWIDENLPPGTVVGSLRTTDPDIDDSFVYQLVSGAGDDDNAAFSISGDQLETTQWFDYETQRFLRLRVRSTDLHGAGIEQELLVIVSDVWENTPPTDVVVNPACALPGTPAETVVSRLLAADIDADQWHWFQLVNGDGDTDNALFRIDDDLLVAQEPLDFTGRDHYSVRIRCEDDWMEGIEKAVEIVRAEPLLTEDFESGADGWTHAALLGPDQWQLDEGYSHSPTHAFHSPGAEATGDSVLVSPPLSVPDNLQWLVLTFTHYWGLQGFEPEAFDGGLLEWSADGTAWAPVTEANGQALFVTGGYNATVLPEILNPLAGRPVWSDSFTGDFVASTVSLRPDLFAGQPLRFRWRLGSDDAEASQGWWIDDVRVYLVQVPLSPPTNITLTPAEVAENKPVGTPVGTLTATDPNPAETHTFTLVAGTGDTDNASFVIDGTTLRTAAVFDHETVTAASIRVQADDGNGGLFARAVEIAITDQPVEDSDGDGFSDYDELVWLGSDPFSAASNFAVRSVARAGSTLTLTFSSVPGMSFQVEGSTNLEPGSWVDLTEPLAADPGVTTVVVDLSLHPDYPADAFFVRVAATR